MITKSELNSMFCAASHEIRLILVNARRTKSTIVTTTKTTSLAEILRTAASNLEIPLQQVADYTIELAPLRKRKS